MHMITRVEFNALNAAYFTVMSRGMKFLFISNKKTAPFTNIFLLLLSTRKVVIIFALNHHY